MRLPAGCVVAEVELVGLSYIGRGTWVGWGGVGSGFFVLHFFQNCVVLGGEPFQVVPSLFLGQ